MSDPLAASIAHNTELLAKLMAANEAQAIGWRGEEAAFRQRVRDLEAWTARERRRAYDAEQRAMRVERALRRLATLLPERERAAVMEVINAP